MSRRGCAAAGHGRHGGARLLVVLIMVPLLNCSACQVSRPVDGPPSSPAAPATSAEATPPSKARTSSSDGAGVEVVEHGFTVTEDSAGVQVSYGVVVENRSVDVALVTQLAVTLLDSKGEPVIDLDRDREVAESAFNLVLPGEEQVYTNMAYVARDDIDSLEIEVTRSRWVAADGFHRPIEVHEVDTAPRGTSGMEIDFTAESPYRGTVQPVYTYALFRSATGEVVGGSRWGDATPHEYPEGVVDGSIDISSGVPEDTTEVEVHVDPLIGP